MSASEIKYTEGIGANIATYLISEGGKPKHIERIAPAAGVVENRGNDISVSATGLVGQTLLVEGCGRIIISLRSATTSATDICAFRLIYIAKDITFIGTSVLTQAIFSEFVDSGERYAVASVFANDVCAYRVQPYIVALPSGKPVVMNIMAV